MSNYIISDKCNIIGCFNQKIDAIIFLLDNIIDKFKFYLDILKINKTNILIPDINSLNITNIMENSANIKAQYKFNLNSYKFVNIITNQNEFISSNSDNMMFVYKIKILEEIINEINKIKDKSQLNIETNNKIIDLESNTNNENNNSLIICDTENDCNNKIENKEEPIDYEKLKKEKEEKEKKDEFKRRFESDKQIYFKIKNEIDDDNIPELFTDQYPIMKIIDSLNIIDNDNGFNFYYKKMCEIIKNKKNIYSSMFNDSSYFYCKKDIILSDSELEDEDEIEINSDQIEKV